MTTIGLFQRWRAMIPRPRTPRTLRHAAAWLALLPALAGVAQPLDPPALRCASVNATGDVVVTWTIPDDPDGRFDHYAIHHGTALGGPFTQVGTVNVHAQANFYHAGANAHLGPRYYYVTTVSNDPVPETSAPSDTVSTLFLQVFQSTPPGSANLAWNAPSVAPTATPAFTIWREYPAGNWSLIQMVDSGTFAHQHVIDICSAYLNFRIGLTDQSGCVSFSNVSGDDFEDVTPPTTPVINAVSVDTISGLSNITWAPSPQNDTQGYIVVLQTPGGGVVIDTVWGHLNTFYEWPFSTAGLAPESFTIAAFDSCYSGTPASPNTSATGPAHTTMHLTATYDPCEDAVRLQWTPYEGWPIGMHQVLRQVDGGPWVLTANAPGSATSAIQPAEAEHQYCYVVRAVSEDGTAFSLSSKFCVNTQQTGLPTYNYLRTVTVLENGTIAVVDSVDPNGVVLGYRFERSDNGGPWHEVYFTPGSGGPLITFLDSDVDANTVGYRYRVVVVDMCGRAVVTSNVGGNIVLRAVPLTGGIDQLNWNGYAEWAGSTVQHRLWRSVDDGPFAEHAVLPPDPWELRDDVSDLIGLTGRVCYRLEAVEGGNPSGIDATAMSNVACAVQEELVFVPNAFVVGGANPVFQPVVGFVDIRNYRLEIMNRWGQVIWHTSDPYQGWDGRVDGHPAPIGVYAYHVQVINGAGRLVDRRGSVTLLTAVE
jgi:hypothetical protein